MATNVGEVKGVYSKLESDKTSTIIHTDLTLTRFAGMEEPLLELGLSYSNHSKCIALNKAGAKRLVKLLYKFINDKI